MISCELARALRTAGVRWTPVTGDHFRIERDGFDGDVFTVSEMTIEAHEYPSGTVLGFNGTTEWALDSVSLEDSLWLPREDQLRELLRGTFRSLRRVTEPQLRFVVEVVLGGQLRNFDDAAAENAYAQALLALVSSVAVDLDDVDALEGNVLDADTVGAPCRADERA
ncbi:hypothetical protein SAMN06295924_101295 [Rathayibacter rathayi NCPPB 2980 = VKM Ac-1601]|uniref:pilus assembly protein CpaE n=1 Tax=Rathayibacter rathayi TaxID=33887 RepID=UPI000BD5C7E6|nr:hypothetical protein FB469_1180 [Rathayibacter rathayi]SOE02204.1 hypothetical protein SAMN06295924_101295 [Rathayibacter rathayi NCPPB 2980 = VKM Ac-1601]